MKLLEKMLRSFAAVIGRNGLVSLNVKCGTKLVCNRPYSKKEFIGDQPRKKEIIQSTEKENVGSRQSFVPKNSLKTFESQLEFRENKMVQHSNDILTENKTELSSSLVSSDEVNDSPQPFRETSRLMPSIPKKSFSLAPYVNKSETLSNLVKLGVDLSIIETNVDVANYIVKADFDRDIRPYLMLLHDCGVPDAVLGELITKNSNILLEPLDDLQVRINYFKSKKFSLESVARLISKAPTLLTTATKQIDSHLGFLQKEFALTGDEVRSVATKYPRIVVSDKRFIQLNKLTFMDSFGFDQTQIKQLLITNPKLYTAGRHALVERFAYLHDIIGFSHADILLWPGILHCRLFILKQRYQFLKLLGRDQFNPKKENYISSKSLVSSSDVDFCANIAKVPVEQYNQFLKSL